MEKTTKAISILAFLALSNVCFAQATETGNRCLNIIKVSQVFDLAEQACGFDKKVTERLYKFFSKTGCDSEIPEKEFDILAKQYFQEARLQVKQKGKAKFCSDTRSGYDKYDTSNILKNIQ